MIRGALACLVLAIMWPTMRAVAWWDDHTGR